MSVVITYPWARPHGYKPKKIKQKNKAASSQALKRVGPPNKESGFKRSSLTSPRAWDIIRL